MAKRKGAVEFSTSDWSGVSFDHLDENEREKSKITWWRTLQSLLSIQIELCNQELARFAFTGYENEHEPDWREQLNLSIENMRSKQIELQGWLENALKDPKQDEWLNDSTPAQVGRRNEKRLIQQHYTETKLPRSQLAPTKHRQLDFFVADLFDASPKDDIASMEHPLFALRPGDRKVKEYRHNNTTVTIKPGVDGQATVNDKDVWIYAISQLIEGMNRGREDVGRTVRFVAYDFLINTNRGVCGRSYERMADALKRLKGTVIETNVETAEKRERAGFGLIDSWRVIERDRDDRMVAVEVTLPDWLYRSVQARQVLTLNRDYFRLRSNLARRIYELARKHCGVQPRWRVSMSVLHVKSGSTAPLRDFRRKIGGMAALNELPNYRMQIDQAEDLITFYVRAQKGTIEFVRGLVNQANRETNRKKTDVDNV